MSADTVDDLHCAEDMMGSLEGALRRLLDVIDVQLVVEGSYQFATAVDQARCVLVEAENYCRPSCCFLDEGECLDGEDCGCPCGHEPREA